MRRQVLNLQQLGHMLGASLVARPNQWHRCSDKSADTRSFLRPEPERRRRHCPACAVSVSSGSDQTHDLDRRTTWNQRSHSHDQSTYWQHIQLKWTPVNDARYSMPDLTNIEPVCVKVLNRISAWCYKPPKLFSFSSYVIPYLYSSCSRLTKTHSDDLALPHNRRCPTLPNSSTNPCSKTGHNYDVTLPAGNWNRSLWYQQSNRRQEHCPSLQFAAIVYDDKVNRWRPLAVMQAARTYLFMKKKSF